MPRNDGNKPQKELEKKYELTKQNVISKKELLDEFSEELTPEEEKQAKVKIANKMRALNHMKGTME
jgi:predicted  nucleic acid-binding Zn-ribbon protein